MVYYRILNFLVSMEDSSSYEPEEILENQLMEINTHAHNWKSVMYWFNKCSYCHKPIRFHRGYVCANKDCKVTVHSKCSAHITNVCPVPLILEKGKNRKKRQDSSGEDDLFKILIIGDSGCGKSSLLLRYSGSI
eukprot:TRINITY_DN582_c0_g1_i4.p1 TRINITY_DN582_c0_g1~~TRINITY_DN582_c0_g1_i4.p1  ORF type:complete len:134 (+),score=13.63 TRINITY_DN582_c0_g1_i4:172-573(+)